MIEPQDIRWKQRFQNYQKALSQLTKFIERGKLNDFEKQGLIQCFEYTYELAWNTMKDFFEAQGETGIFGSRDAFRLAFKRQILQDGEAWMEMIKSRVLSSHTYQEKIADELAEKITTTYYEEFLKLENRFIALAQPAL